MKGGYNFANDVGGVGFVINVEMLSDKGWAKVGSVNAGDAIAVAIRQIIAEHLRPEKQDFVVRHFSEVSLEAMPFSFQVGF